jgi:single-stranded-DNA-specific exonuclease
MQDFKASTPHTASDSTATKSKQNHFIPRPHQARRWVFKDAEESTAEALQKELKIHPVLCQLLVQRGINTFEEAKRFFRPQWSHLHDPFLLDEMDKALDRLDQAFEGDENVLLYGDYDVDGTTSVALLCNFFRSIGKTLGTYTPNRYREGYGISKIGIDWAAEKKYTLMVALDCGIKAVEMVEYAREKGIDLIICDHHLPGEKIPDAVAVLDPKKPNCPYPYKELSGCGIGFKLAQAYCIRHQIDNQYLIPLLDLLAISIASDIVPITGENRTLTQLGLQRLNTQPSPGLKKLMDKAGLEAPVNITDIVFGLGPRINAAGRMQDASGAVELLTAQHYDDAELLATELNDQNAQRKETDRQITSEALQLMEGWADLDQRFSTVVYAPHWHKGVIGIVASRLIEHHYKPTIVLCKSGEEWVGSARSIRGFNIHDALVACSDLLERFGGHRYAAGMTLKEENLPAFRNQFEAYVQEHLDPDLLVPELAVDAKLSFNSVHERFYKILDQFAPFGPGNMRPVFASSQVRDCGWSKVVGKDHLKLRVRQINSNAVDGIAFGMGAQLDLVKKKRIELAYQLDLNEWQGKKNIQLKVKDLREQT